MQGLKDKKEKTFNHRFKLDNKNYNYLNYSRKMNKFKNYKKKNN